MTTPIVSYSLANDIFNSAPLVVVYGGGSAAARVFVTSAKGYVFAFNAGAGVAAGPVWMSQDLPAIPDVDLPVSTYCFMSVTPTGTLLVTTSMGGATWNDQKAFVAIVNGVLPLPSSSPKAGLSAGAKAGITIGVLLSLGAAGGVAFFKVPAFASFVNNAASSAKDLVGNVIGSGGGYRLAPSAVPAAATFASSGASTYGAV